MGAPMQTPTDGLPLLEACTAKTRQGQITLDILANIEANIEANDLLVRLRTGTDPDHDGHLKEPEVHLGEQ